ncbi:hypothetical protein DK26_15030 [Bosea sp. WAO]|uniref:phage tail tube protein n=1 Tax=Bosea sp. WAO TaxID=406341 RepID=UPI00074AD4E9|nr:phage tail tube protein [Bosea sp. WAO]KUL94325.1 hypothetical protein DK26_15030 [Bosea sp. WAO]
MTSSNRVRVSYVMESTPGVTPTTPRMKQVRLTGESLSGAPEYVDSDELRDDRMNADPIMVGQTSGGGINFELSYPHPQSFVSDGLRAALFSDWLNTPERDNDGTADSVITAVAGTTDEFTVTTGAAFVANHLLRATGFATAANNGVWKVTTGGTTSVAVLGANLVTEAAPPATARLKVVGFEGASADITALADGLGSTALDFTTLGLRKGQWIKIGGTADATTFAFLVTAGAVARAAAWARVTDIAAGKLTLDNLPSGWSTDVGTGKTIRVWFGDQLKNGVTPAPMTIERGFMGQQVPAYIVNRGMQAGQLELTMEAKQKITGAFTFTGLTASQGTVTLDASPDPATTNQVMAGSANVGRLAEGGSRLTSPNWARRVSFTVNANLEAQDAVDNFGAVYIREGENTVTGQIDTYFGSNAVLQKFYDGTVTSLNGRVAKNNQAVVIQIPRATLRGGGNPSAGGKNQTVTAQFDFSGALDPETGANIIFDRLEYFA